MSDGVCIPIFAFMRRPWLRNAERFIFLAKISSAPPPPPTAPPTRRDRLCMSVAFQIVFQLAVGCALVFGVKTPRHGGEIGGLEILLGRRIDPISIAA